MPDLGDDSNPDFESKSEENVASMQMKVLNKWRVKGSYISKSQRHSKGKWNHHSLETPVSKSRKLMNNTELWAF